MESVVPSSSPDDIQVFRDHDSDTGFYVRIKGHYAGQKDFILSYTSFNTGECILICIANMTYKVCWVLKTNDLLKLLICMLFFFF